MSEVASQTKTPTYAKEEAGSTVINGSLLIGLGFAAMALVIAIPPKEIHWVLLACAGIITCFMTGIPRLIKGTIDLVRSE